MNFLNQIDKALLRAEKRKQKAEDDIVSLSHEERRKILYKFIIEFIGRMTREELNAFNVDLSIETGKKIKITESVTPAQSVSES